MKIALLVKLNVKIQILKKICNTFSRYVVTLASTFTFEQFGWLISKLILLSPNQNAWEISFLRNQFTDVCGPYEMF